MGTISDKLVYLDGTREQIKENLNKFGSNITENDTFRSYSNVINDIYDKLPKVSANGSNFSLENAQNGKLDSFGMEGNTEQTTYSGINILLQNEYVSSKTVNGITYTNNGDGTFNLSGTATANTSLRIIDVGVFNLESGQAYYLYSSVPYNVDTFNMSIVAVVDGVNVYFRANTTYTPSTTPTNSRLQFYVASGNTVNVQNVKLMLVKGSSATEYEPYVGGTPSPNPDYPQNINVVSGNQVVNVSGKNKMGFADGTYTNNQGITATVEGGKVILNGTGTANPSGVTIPLSKSIVIQTNTQYTLSAFNNSINSNVLLRLQAVGSSNPYSNAPLSSVNATATIQSSEEYEIDRLFIRVDQNTTLNNFIIYPQLEKCSTATTYEPYQSQDYEIDLLDYELCKIGDYKDVIFKNNQLSSYYDSTLDEDSWYIKKEIGKVVLNGSENYYIYSIDDKIMRFQSVDMNGITIPQTPYYSDKFIYMGKVAEIHEVGITSGASETRSCCFIFINKTIANTIEEFKTWLSTHNTEVYYVLATPTYEKITNETLISQLEAIETHTGTNIFEVSNENNVLPSLNVKRLKELEKLS